MKNKYKEKAKTENLKDVHQETAQKLFNTSNITPEQRRLAKTINFGIVYGTSSIMMKEFLK